MLGWLTPRLVAESPSDHGVDFERQIRPIFNSRCLKCHGPTEPKAELNLTRPDSALALEAIVPGKPDAGSLLERIAATDASLRMPPEGPPLSDAEIALLRRWIEEGAPWPQHWAYRALQKPAAPKLHSADLQQWCRTPVDRFIAERLELEALQPSPPADRKTLLRRASFDLLGLPPTPAELEAFLNDNSPDAWERCIDRLLSSPAYGERWARRWMDLTHFAETHGHDQDRPRENAWPYRDYLIHSFNRDKPYAEFVAEQIAGDVLRPLDPDAIVATGFLAAGPWDESSLRDIREDSIDRVIGQYLDRDDIVTTVMSTFASTSVHCARCHDHKFDPITQAEYYGLQAVFAGIDKANRKYDPDPQVARLRDELEAEQTQLQQLYASSPTALLTLERGKELADWERRQAEQGVLWRPLQATSFTSQSGAKLKLLDDASLLAEGVLPDKDVYLVEGKVDLQRVTAVRLDVLPDPSLPQQGPGRAENGNLHLSEVHLAQVFPAADDSVRELTCNAPHADFNQQGWAISAAVDGNPDTAWGIHPEEGKPHHSVFPLTEPAAADASVMLRVELHQVHGRAHLIGRFRISATDADADRLQQAAEIPWEISQILAIAAKERSEAQQTQLAYWYAMRRIEERLSALPPQQRVYAGTNRFEAEGSFRPVATPRPVHVLHRGLATEPLQEALPGALACCSTTPAFMLRDANNEGDRRRALAEWLAAPYHPLVGRSIVNRVWQAHFGRGLVDTPNDFGQMGAAPTHPKLLDWLACTLQERHGSLKELHRLICTSAVYQQSSDIRPDAMRQDADNRWLWRMSRRRLDAESYRDAMLQVVGTLDRSVGGPSVRQFIQTPGTHVTPNVDYQGFDVDAAANYRRSVYRFVFRTIPDPLMEALDCPDASQLAPKRNTSLTALQALATLNDKLLVRQSELFAERLQREEPSLAARMTLAFRRTLGREPDADELQALSAYTKKHGLANTCRLLFNTNEFLFLD